MKPVTPAVQQVDSAAVAVAAHHRKTSRKAAAAFGGLQTVAAEQKTSAIATGSSGHRIGVAVVGLPKVGFVLLAFPDC